MKPSNSSAVISRHGDGEQGSKGELELSVLDWHTRFAAQLAIRQTISNHRRRLERALSISRPLHRRPCVFGWRSSLHYVDRHLAVLCQRSAPPTRGRAHTQVCHRIYRKLHVHCQSQFYACAKRHRQNGFSFFTPQTS